MYPAFVRGCQLPLSLFHPRWLFDGPLVLHESWQILWEGTQQAPSPAREPDMSRSRFHGRGKEMVKGAAMETVLLLRQCPPSVAENYTVAVRDMNAALLELPPFPLPQPNAREFPTSWKRRMTGYEAAIQEQRNAAVRCRRQLIQAPEDDDFRQAYTQEAVARIIERHSQFDPPPPPSLSPASPTPPSLPNSSSSSDSESPRNVDPGGVSGGHRSWSTIARQRKTWQRRRGEREGQGNHEAQAREEGIDSGSGNVTAPGWLCATTQQYRTAR